MKTYKIEREQIDGAHAIFFYDEDEATAYRVWRRMRKQKVLKTVWADLIVTDWDGDPDEGDKIACGFEREVVEAFGQKVFTGRVIDY